MKRKHNIVLIWIFSILLTGCDRKETFHDLETYIAQLKQTQVSDGHKSVTPLPVPPPPISPVHATLTSPFATTTTVTRSAATGLTPLQSYPVSALRFTGIVHEHGKWIAYIATPDNKIYPVKEGDIIGDHYGKIIKVEHDRIDVMEPGSPEEKTSQRLISLQLKDKL